MAIHNFEIDQNGDGDAGPSRRIRIAPAKGWFVTYPKAGVLLILVIISILAAITITAVIMTPEIIPERNNQYYENLIDNSIATKLSQGAELRKVYRLETTVYPTHYRLKIEPILSDNFTFNGSVTITVSCQAPTNVFELNAKNLNVTDVTLHLQLPQKDSSPSMSNNLDDSLFKPKRTTNDEFIFAVKINIPISRIVYVQRNNKMAVYLKEWLQEGRNYTLRMNFSGHMSAAPQGFHYNRYLENNIPKYFAVTQFEPVFAREAFPCFDEPKYRSAFEISIMRKNNVRSLSNAQLESTEEIVWKPGFVWDHYEVTPSMPSYLVAFAIGDLISHPAQVTKHGIEIRVWAISTLQKPARSYVELIAPGILEYYMDTFEAPYPFKKLDIMFSVMGIGGMENYGLIVLNEDLLFVNSTSNTNALETTFQVLAHELAHLWFGDLVSIGWWDDMWMKEGLTQYVELLPMSRLLSEDYNINTTFSAASVNNVMLADQYLQSPPVSAAVNDPIEISERFDDITYEKGAAVFRMLNYTLTEPVMTKGLRHYLKTWAFKSIEPHNLYDSFTWALQEEPNHAFKHLNITVTDFMKTWIDQAGYPILTITRNYETGDVVIQQHRFLILANQTSSSTWYVPLTYFVSTDHDNFQNEKFLLLPAKKTSTFSGMVPAANTTWIVCNIHQKGMYRVNYDPTNWKLLLEEVQANRFPLSLQIQLMEDAIALAQLRLVDFGTALNLTLFIRDVNNYNAWISWSVALEFLNLHFADDPIYGLLKMYFAYVMRKQYNKKRNMDNDNDAKMNALIKHLACGTELDDCVKWARKEFERFVEKSEQPSEDYREIIYCTVIRHGGQYEWNYLWNRSVSIKYDDPTEYIEILRALTCSSEKWILRRYLIMAILERQVDTTGLLHILSYYTTPTAIQAGFEFLRRNSNVMKEVLAESINVSIQVYKHIFWGLSNEMQLKQLLELFDPTDKFIESKAKIMKTAVERIKARIEFERVHAPQVRSWLQQHFNRTYF